MQLRRILEAVAEAQGLAKGSQRRRKFVDGVLRGVRRRVVRDPQVRKAGHGRSGDET